MEQSTTNSSLATKETGNAILDTLFYWNSLEAYIFWAAFLFVTIIVLRIIRPFVSKKLARSQHVIATYYLKLEKFIFPILYTVMLYVAFHALDKPTKLQGFLSAAFAVAFILLATRLLASILSTLIYGYLTHQETAPEKIKQIRGIVIILTGMLWILALIVLFDNLGFNVTTVLTGLGVGGIAIALAAQTILGDIFNYFVIFFDRPFEVGDFIVVDDKMGVVDYIGIKSTRLRSLSGEQIVFSNTNLTNSRVHNYKRMSERRIVFKFGVTYDTGYRKLEQIPQIVKDILVAQENVRFDRAHFAAYGEYSIDFEVVYYLLSSDYNLYMDVQQSINMALYKQFEEAGIEFAFPTYSLKVNGRIKSKQNGMDLIVSEQ
jgi:small-conductance mechanosensitive channel